MEELKAEIIKIKNQIGALKIFLVVYLMVLIFVTILFGKEYIAIHSYYLSTQEMNRELILESEKQKVYLLNILSKMED